MRKFTWALWAVFFVSTSSGFAQDPAPGDDRPMESHEVAGTAFGYKGLGLLATAVVISPSMDDQMTSPQILNGRFLGPKGEELKKVHSLVFKKLQGTLTVMGAKERRLNALRKKGGPDLHGEKAQLEKEIRQLKKDALVGATAYEEALDSQLRKALARGNSAQAAHLLDLKKGTLGQFERNMKKIRWARGVSVAATTGAAVYFTLGIATLASGTPYENPIFPEAAVADSLIRPQVPGQKMKRTFQSPEAQKIREALGIDARQ